MRRGHHPIRVLIPGRGLIAAIVHAACTFFGAQHDPAAGDVLLRLMALAVLASDPDLISAGLKLIVHQTPGKLKGLWALS
jgi:hypothetical protein